jgi:hypothetical protein
VKRFLQPGVAGLSDRPKVGQPRQSDDKATTEIRKAAAARPKDLGLKFTTWSLPQLQAHLSRQAGLGKITPFHHSPPLASRGLPISGRANWVREPGSRIGSKKTKS